MEQGCILLPQKVRPKEIEIKSKEDFAKQYEEFFDSESGSLVEKASLGSVDCC